MELKIEQRRKNEAMIGSDIVMLADDDDNLGHDR
jgi:hypothetical protein